MALPILPEHVERNILLIRGHRVILDTDLAILYGVQAKRLNEQVMRNKKRFPSDSMFQLTAEEVERLRSKIATLKPGRGQHRKYRPYGFTEQGVAMLSSVLHSERAIQVNIAIMRAFVQLREMIGSNKGLVRRLNEMEKKYDSRFRVVFEAIRELMAEPEPQVKRIGFKT
ncbi:MAG: ORF6N domain-containing protein [Nitrospirota bacterium]